LLSWNKQAAPYIWTAQTNYCISWTPLKAVLFFRRALLSKEPCYHVANPKLITLSFQSNLQAHEIIWRGIHSSSPLYVGFMPTSGNSTPANQVMLHKPLAKWLQQPLSIIATWLSLAQPAFHAAKHSDADSVDMDKSEDWPEPTLLNPGWLPVSQRMHSLPCGTHLLRWSVGNVFYLIPWRG
jgi:hypothetical protein